MARNLDPTTIIFPSLRATTAPLVSSSTQRRKMPLVIFELLIASKKLFPQRQRN
jgi:hypothetical protein